MNTTNTTKENPSFPTKSPGVWLALLALLLLASSVAFWPADALVIQDAAGRLAFSAAMPLGRSFETQYIHSVQLSPVRDLYFIRDGLFREWQTWVQSQNAGLPTVAPARGRYRMEAPWLIFEGDTLAAPVIALRIGDAQIGQNQMRLGRAAWTPLYTRFPGQRLHLAAVRRALYAR